MTSIGEYSSSLQYDPNMAFKQATEFHAQHREEYRAIQQAASDVEESLTTNQPTRTLACIRATEKKITDLFAVVLSSRTPDKTGKRTLYAELRQAIRILEKKLEHLFVNSDTMFGANGTEPAIPAGPQGSPRMGQDVIAQGEAAPVGATLPLVPAGIAGTEPTDVKTKDELLSIYSKINEQIFILGYGLARDETLTSHDVTAETDRLFSELRECKGLSTAMVNRLAYSIEQKRAFNYHNYPVLHVHDAEDTTSINILNQFFDHYDAIKQALIAIDESLGSDQPKRTLDLIRAAEKQITDLFAEVNSNDTPDYALINELSKIVRDIERKLKNLFCKESTETTPFWITDSCDSAEGIGCDDISRSLMDLSTKLLSTDSESPTLVSKEVVAETDRLYQALTKLWQKSEPDKRNQFNELAYFIELRRAFDSSNYGLLHRPLGL